MNLGLNYLASVSHYVPELIALLTMIGVVFLEATYDGTEKRTMMFNFAYAGLLVSLIALCSNLSNDPTAIFFNAVVIDPFSTLMKVVMVLGTIGSVYISQNSRDIYADFRSEFVLLSIGVLIGGMILASANNLLSLYIGIETLSILSYVLAGLKRNDELSSEAGLKYSLYGGLSAGLMLFGMSHIYGVLHTIQFAEVSAVLKGITNQQLGILIPSFLLFFAGLGYKIASVPFHMWSPDVYEGSPLPVTTFFSIVPKVAGIAAIIRVTHVFFGADGFLQYSWVALLLVISVLTMTVGNVAAIGQQSVKRMLAYSSISHAGFMLMGALLINQNGASSVAFYAIVYLFMTLVCFYVVSYVADYFGNDDFERFNGLIHTHPLAALILSMAMLSLAGVPPLGGFVSKFNLLSAVIKQGHYTLAIIAGLNSVVSLYYYMKIVRYMILNKPESEEKISGFTNVNMTVLTIVALPILVLGLFWNNIVHIASQATLYIQ